MRTLPCATVPVAEEDRGGNQPAPVILILDDSPSLVSHHRDQSRGDDRVGPSLPPISKNIAIASY